MALQESMQLPEQFSVVFKEKVFELLRAFHFKIRHALSLADRKRIVPDLLGAGG